MKKAFSLSLAPALLFVALLMLLGMKYPASLTIRYHAINVMKMQAHIRNIPALTAMSIPEAGWTVNTGKRASINSGTV